MTRALVAFAFITLVFGTTFGAIRIGIDDGWPPFLAAGVRFMLGGLLVLAFARAGGEVRHLSREQWRDVALVGLTVTAGTFGALYNAERFVPSGIAAVLSAAGPLFAVMLAISNHSRRLDLSVVGGIAIATVGVVCICGLSGLSGAGAFAGAAAIIVSEFGYVWGLARAKEARATVSALQLAGSQQLIGGGVLLALSLVFEHRLPARIDPVGLGALAYLIVVGSAVAHSVSIWLAGATSATLASSWTYISPFIALVFGALLLRETPSATAWFGGVLVVAGAALLNRNLRSTLKSAPARQPPAPSLHRI